MSISDAPEDPILRAAYESGRASRQGQIDAQAQQLHDLYAMQKSLTDEIRTLREVCTAQMRWERFCEKIADCFEDVEGETRLRDSDKSRYRGLVRQVVLEVRRVRREMGNETDEELRARGVDPEIYRRKFLEERGETLP